MYDHAYVCVFDHLWMLEIILERRNLGSTHLELQLMDELKQSLRPSVIGFPQLPQCHISVTSALYPFPQSPPNLSYAFPKSSPNLFYFLYN